MTDTLADDMQAWYAGQLGHQGSVIELEREYFGAATNETWADAALDFYASANGSSPVGSLQDEIFKYYSRMSGLTPAANYSTADHMMALFGTSGGGHNLTPPITDQLEAFFDAAYIDGYAADGRVSKNLLTVNQASIETDTAGLAVAANCTIARSTAFAKHGVASLSLTSVAGGTMSGRTAGGAFTIPVSPNTQYTAVGSSRSAVSARSARAFIIWYDSSLVQIGANINGSSTTNSTSAWTDHFVTATSPSNAAFCLIGIEIIATGGASEVHYIDCLGFWLGSSTDWVMPGKLHNINLLTYNQATIETDLTGLSPSATRSTAQAAQGVASALVTSIGAGFTQWGVLALAANAVPVTPGRTYTAVISAYAPVITVSFVVSVVWYDSTMTFISQPSGNSVALATSWKQSYYTAVAPANAAYMVIRGAWTAVGAGEQVYFDKLGAWEGAVQEWVAPYRATRPANGDGVDFWRDLSGKGRHQFQNTVAQQPLYRDASRNMLTYNQATVETDLTGFSLTAFNATIARSTTQARHGVASVACTITTANFPGCYTLTGVSGIPIVPGRTYTAVVSSWIVSASRKSQLYIYWWKADGSAASTPSSPGSQITLTASTWMQVSATGVAPADAAYAQVRWVSPDAPGALVIGDVFYLDQWGLWEGSSTVWIPPAVIPNGKQSVQFDGIAQRLSGIFTALNVAACTTYSVIAPNYIPGATNRRVFQATGVTFYHVLTAASGQMTAGFATSFATGAPIAANATGITAGVARTTEAQSYINGAASGIDATDPVGITGTTLDIAHVAGAGFFPGQIMAILIYSGTHTDAQRDQIEAWLGARYGVTVA